MDISNNYVVTSNETWAVSMSLKPKPHKAPAYAYIHMSQQYRPNFCHNHSLSRRNEMGFMS